MGLKDQQKSGYALYHKMTTIKKATDEEVNSIAMSMIQVIRDHPKTDKKGFYSVMRQWGVS